MTEPTTSDAPQAPQRASVPSSDLVCWLNRKITEAESALRFREQATATWKSGDDKLWETVAAMHESTAGKVMKKGDRIREARRHTNIAAKCKYELYMLKRCLAAVSQHTGELCSGANNQ
jgi:hypothetical protein